MVVLFGDHGENMTEHDAWFDHAGLYDWSYTFPVLIWAPGVVPESEVTALVSTVDIKPTVLDFLGMPGSQDSMGGPFAPSTEGSTDIHRDAVFLSECTWQAKRGVRTETGSTSGVQTQVSTRGAALTLRFATRPSGADRSVRPAPEHRHRDGGVALGFVEDPARRAPRSMDEVVAMGLPAVKRLNDLVLTC